MNDIFLKIRQVLLSSSWYDRWRKIHTISFFSCCMKRNLITSTFPSIFTYFIKYSIFTIIFSQYRGNKSMDSLDHKQCWRWSDMIPSKSIRWLYLLSFLECKKVRISFDIDEWLCEFFDKLIIIFYDSISKYFTLFFSSMHRTLSEILSS